MMKSSDAGNRTLLTGQRKSKKTIAGSVAFVFLNGWAQLLKGSQSRVLGRLE